MNMIIYNSSNKTWFSSGKMATTYTEHTRTRTHVIGKEKEVKTRTYRGSLLSWM